MTCHVTSHEVWHIASSTVPLSKCQLISSNLLPLQPMSQTYEASIFKTRASEFSSLIGSTISLNIIKFSNSLSDINKLNVESPRLRARAEQV